MARDLKIVPESVGRASRAWDEQHLDLLAAAGQIGRAAQGFSPDVATAARRFVSAWEQHTEKLAALCEIRADGLRDTIADLVATDGIVSANIQGLAPYLDEIR